MRHAFAQTYAPNVSKAIIIRHKMRLLKQKCLHPLILRCGFVIIIIKLSLKLATLLCVFKYIPRKKNCKIIKIKL